MQDFSGKLAVVTGTANSRGIGMAIEDRIGDLRSGVPVEVLGLPTRFLPHEARPERLLSQLGLDADGIAAAARRLLTA